jgi:tyrosine-protein kinase Etk/Wzc
MDTKWSPLESSKFRDAEDDLDIIRIFQNIKRHWVLFYVVLILFVVIGGVYSVFATPRYEADALVQVDQQQGSALGALADVSSALELGVNPVDGELDVIKSRATIYPAIDELGAQVETEVANRFPIIGKLFARHYHGEGLAPAPWGLEKFAWGGEQLSVNDFTIPAENLEDKFYLTVLTNNTWKLSDDDGNVLATGENNKPVKFSTSYLSHTPDSSINIGSFLANPGTQFIILKRSKATVFGDIYKHFDAEQTTRDSSTIRISFVGPNAAFAKSLVNAVADAYVKLNVAHKAEQSKLSLEFLRAKLPEIRQKTEEAEFRLNQYRTKSNMIDIDGQTQALLEQEANIESQRAQAEVTAQSQSQIYGATHPLLRAQQAQVSELKKQDELLNQKIKSLPLAQQEFVRLSLDVEVNTKLYTALLENEQQLEVVDAGTTGNVFVAEDAVLPELAKWPKIPLILSGSVLIGLLAAFLVVQLRVSMLGAIKDPAEAEHVVDVPLLAVIPLSISKKPQGSGQNAVPWLHAHVYPNDRAIEAIRSLRSALQFSADAADKRVILFTGATPGVGKTFLSVNFAYLLANAGKKVLLLDADMRRSSVKRYITLSPGPGLAELLAKTANISQCVQKKLSNNLDVISAFNVAPKYASEMLESDQFAKLIRDLKVQYDYVIIDSPPVLPVSDTLWISRHSEAVIFVSRANVTSSRQLYDALAKLTNVGAPIVGQVFNGFEPKQVGYGYNYGYEYYTHEKS